MTKGLDIASVIVVKLLFIDDGQLIGFKLVDCGLAKKDKRRTLKLYGDSRMARCQALSGAKVNWHVRPAPVVDHQLESGKGFCF